MRTRLTQTLSAVIAVLGLGGVADAAPAAAVACDPARLHASEFIGLVVFEDGAVAASPVQRAAVEIARTARKSGYMKLLVVGHADESGTPPTNQYISERRAENVAAALGPALPVPLTLTAMGCGETFPLLPMPGRSQAHNRRVEIRGEP